MVASWIWTTWPSRPVARMPSRPLPVSATLPVIETGSRLADTSAMLTPWPPLLVNLPPLIASGDCERTPSVVV